MAFKDAATLTRRDVKSSSGNSPFVMMCFFIASVLWLEPALFSHASRLPATNPR